MGEPMFEIEAGPFPRFCFPVGFPRDGLQEITRSGDAWRKYINVRTGETVDCAEFARQWQEGVWA